MQKLLDKKFNGRGYLLCKCRKIPYSICHFHGSFYKIWRGKWMRGVGCNIHTLQLAITSEDCLLLGLNSLKKLDMQKRHYKTNLKLHVRQTMSETKKTGKKWKSVEQIDIKLCNILVMIVSLINMVAKINQKRRTRWFLLVF